MSSGGSLKQLSIVLPVYNERDALSHTLERLAAIVPRLRNECRLEAVTLVFVDDGSADGSAQILRDLKTKYADIPFKILRFSRNFGHSAAVFAGLEATETELVAIVDADLQDPPELLVDMVNLLNAESADVVYGKRRARAGEGLFKLFSAWFFYRLINALSGTDIPRDTGDFRVITREVRDAVVRLPESEPFLRGLVAWVGYKQLPFLYDRQPRLHGETKYPFKRMLRFAVQAIMSFSSFPLKLAIYLGLAGVTLSSALGLYALAIWLRGIALPGWTSVVIAFSFGQSLTLFLVGVMGMYVGRVHTATQNRPRYILRKES